MSSELLKAGDVARILRVSEAWVRQHSSGARRPQLPRVKLGAAVRYRPEDIEAFIQKYSEIASDGGDVWLARCPTLRQIAGMEPLRHPEHVLRLRIGRLNMSKDGLLVLGGRCGRAGHSQRYCGDLTTEGGQGGETETRMSELPDLSELHAKTEQNRAEFLKTDLKLCFTFAEIAKTELRMPSDPEAAECALQKAEDGYDTISGFLSRVQDVETRNEIERKLVDLRIVLDGVHALVHGGSETDA
jgi:hypothetical protein